jgi:hypothetical protein
VTWPGWYQQISTFHPILVSFPLKPTFDKIWSFERQKNEKIETIKVKNIEMWRPTKMKINMHQALNWNRKPFMKQCFQEQHFIFAKIFYFRVGEKKIRSIISFLWSRHEVECFPKKFKWSKLSFFTRSKDSKGPRGSLFQDFFLYRNLT